MAGQDLSRARRLAFTAGAASLALAFALPAAAVAGETEQPSGAPKQAVVELDALQTEVPPPAFALACLTFPDCTTSGEASFHTEAEVPVEFESAENASSGSAPLDYLNANGYVFRTITCRGSSPAVSSRNVRSGISGELAVSDLRAGAGANTLALTLEPGGESGERLPREVVNAGEGGCGVPQETRPLEVTVWNANFTGAHQDEWQQDGGFRIDGLAWDANHAAFSKSYTRPVTVGYGPLAYTYREHTDIQVRPKFCEGPLNRIASATANGQSLGIDGMRTYPGQVVSAPPGSKLTFGDGAVMELDKGGSFEVDKCPEGKTEFSLTRSLNKAWIEVKKALSGSDAKFNVRTDRAVAGVRGTKYQLSYNKPKQLTRVAVKEGVVSLKGINGAKGEVLIKAGQVGVQKGRHKPKLIKR